VLLEKPMALTVEDARAVRDAAVRTGRVLALGHEIRTFAWAEAARAAIEDGSLGRVRHLDLALWRRPYRAGAGGWKADPAKVGSSILEEPIHYLDLARWWLGDPAALQAFATSRAGREGAWENLDVRLFSPGAQATVRRSIAAWGHRVDLTIVGDDGAFRAVWAGTMDADPAPRQQAWLHRGADRDAPAEAVELRDPSGHAHDLPRQAQAFLAACDGRGEPVANADDGVEAVRLCLETERSLREGERRVELR
jgi:myo-inositol 2-dehydrogenase/D-chiro-inositol 1-dehydrogenase